MYLTLRLTRIALFVLMFLLIACSGVSKRDSEPRNITIDFAAIDDATPKDEPFSRYGNPKKYSVRGKTYYTLKSNHGFKQKGDASWYGTKFHGRRTSSGETYDMYAMTAAHKTLPLPSYVKVTNLDNDKQIVVKVNDRGPFHEGRIIDLSYVAALKLDIVKSGTGRVEIEVIETRAEKSPTENNQSEIKQVFIQVGAFSDEGNAQQIRKKLAAAAIESEIYRVVLSARKPIYRVLIGPFAQRDEAENVVQSLTELDVGKVKIMSYNGE